MKYHAIGLAVLLLGSLPVHSDEIASRNPMPYQNINWNTVSQVSGATHIHMGDQSRFNQQYDAGLRFFTLSNYYPSAPYYPLASMRQNQFRIGQSHGVMRNGQFIPGPIDWNATILDPVSGWADDLAAAQRDELPFSLGDPLFPNIPEDVIEAPNAEHHSFTDTSAHINSPGSLFASGNFDIFRNFLLEQNGFARGSGMQWRDAFGRMLDELLIADGGGITINHPIYSSLPASQIHEMLDFDPRVLGMEIYNETCINERPEKDTSQNEALWDAVLATGRQCFGFFTPDHGTQGRCVLLVEEPTAEACLRAYRQGEFYGAIRDGGLAFERIEANSQSVSVELDSSGTIEFITENGIVQTTIGESAVYNLPQEDVTFVRVKAYDNTGQILFSQPMMIGEAAEPPPPELELVDMGAPDTGLRRYILKATGSGIVTLSKFTIDGELHQVFDSAGNPSEWLGDGSASATEITDSHVIFGDICIPDLGGATWDWDTYPDGPPDKVTEEKIGSSGNSGLGMLSNFDEILGIRDAYMVLGDPSAEEETVDLMQLVVPDGKGVTVTLTLTISRGYDPQTGESTITTHELTIALPTLIAGDANGDGHVDADDAAVLAQHWLQKSGATWADGDFNRDGAVNDIDATLLAANWQSVAPSSVPEPSTLVLLGGITLSFAPWRKNQ